MINHPFYFGCWRDVGHYLWLPGMTHSWAGWFSKFAGKLDGVPPPRDTLDQGVASLHYLCAQRPDCVTALAFWDRSVDRRPGSNSVFFIPGRHVFDDALAAAREAFPQVFDRFEFEVTRDMPAESKEVR
jgi:hypothetical protein